MGYFCLPRENTLRDYMETARCNLRLFYPGYDYLLDFAKYDLERALKAMKQQVLEQALDNIIDLVDQAYDELNKEEIQVHRVQHILDKAIALYDATKNIPAPPVSNGEVSEN